MSGSLSSFVAAGAALALGLSGCAAPDATGNPGDSLQVVVAFYPFQFVAERVGGSGVQVSNLTQPGAEPHDLELTPRQVGALQAADLVVYQSGFQPAVDEAVSQSGNGRVLDVAAVVALETTAVEEHVDEHDSAEEQYGSADGEHAHEHGEGEADPHTWLDPTNVVTMAEAVRDQLSAVDPANAAAYARNASALKGELAELDADFSAGLATCQRPEFITTHAAFGYLAHRYGLTQIGISGISPDAEPSPARIAAVHREAQEHGVTTIFTETLVSPAVAESIAGDLGLRTDVLDPIEGITEQSRGADYVSVMRANLAALREAGGCR